MPVVYVTDGATIGVRTPAGQIARVRMIGVDTPETKKPGTRVQCGGPQATAYTKTALTGRSVWLEHDPVAGRHDKYGRELAYIWLGDRLINNDIIAAGHGRQYAFNNQNYRYRDTFERSETTAKARNLGQWNTCR